MWTIYRSSSQAILITIVSLVAAGAIAPGASAQQATGGDSTPWLDVAGQPLPFRDDAAVLEALRSAKVLNRNGVDRPGLEAFEMLVLELDDARFHALFRRGTTQFEIAAYELDRLLGLHHVPPTVERSVDGETGVVQIWRQRAGTEHELADAGILIPPKPRDYHRQQQSMYLLDNLIANPTRSPENVIIDPDWKIWLIDHTGAFEQTSKLLYQLELTKCDRTLWKRLQELDKHSLQEQMGPYLDKGQVSRLVARHRKLVKHIRHMITTFGEDVVLFHRAVP